MASGRGEKFVESFLWKTEKLSSLNEERGLKRARPSLLVGSTPNKFVKGRVHVQSRAHNLYFSG